MKKMVLVAMCLLSLTGCVNSKSSQAKIEAARQAGRDSANAAWSAEHVEVTQSSDEKNIGAKVGSDMKSFQIGDQQVRSTQAAAEAEGENNIITFVIDRRTGLFHRPECEEVEKITSVNRQNFYGSKDDALAQTWQPCTICKP